MANISTLYLYSLPSTCALQTLVIKTESEGTLSLLSFPKSKVHNDLQRSDAAALEGAEAIFHSRVERPRASDSKTQQTTDCVHDHFSHSELNSKVHTKPRSSLRLLSRLACHFILASHMGEEGNHMVAILHPSKATDLLKAFHPNHNTCEVIFIPDI